MCTCTFPAPVMSLIRAFEAIKGAASMLATTHGATTTDLTSGPGPSLKRLVRDLMNDVDRHVESFLVAARGMDGYSVAFSSGILTEDQVREKAYPSMEYLLRLIGGEDIPQRLQGIPEKVGRTRALQDFPLTWLMEGIRENFRIIWTALIARSKPEDRAELVQSAFRVWEAVEHYSLGVVRAYQQTELELARRQEDVRSAWFRRLLGEEGHLPTVQRAANVLKFDVTASFAVAVAPSRGHRWLQGAASELLAKHVPCHRDDTQDGEVLVAQVSQRAERLVEAALADVTCCVASAKGLSDVPRAVRYAAVVSQLLPVDQGRPRPLGSAWLAVVADRLSDGTGEAVHDDILGSLDDLSPAESRVLRETLLAHLLGEGTAADTARRLFCHRNTVLNRLRRFTELTGLDVSRPRDATLTLLALLYDNALGENEHIRLLVGQ